MTYTPINWQTGDTITAEKMNKMDNGWGVSSTQLFSETVTTTSGQYGNSASLAYSSAIIVPTLYVTYDGDDYVCPAVEMNGTFSYGGMGEMGPDFTDYPFLITPINESNELFTETAGSHTISASQNAVEVSELFVSATEAASPVFVAVSERTIWQDIADAIDAHKLVIVFNGNAINAPCCYASRAVVDESENYVVYSMEASSDAIGSITWIASSPDSPIEQSF